ncbi:MAG: hypothetical protein ACI8ZM_002171 [Crocinitomix sp.]|jgi:hypothetical protein
MQRLLIFLLLLTTQFSFGQDTLYLKTGEQRAVQIIELDTTVNLVGYVYQGDTIYATTESFEKVIYLGNLSSVGSLANTAVIQDSEATRANIISKIKPNPKYLYGKWAISTNLTSVSRKSELNHYSINPVFSVEPEYFLMDRLSLKMPLSFGIPTKEVTYYATPHRFKFHNAADKIPYVWTSQNGRKQMGHARDLLIQIGLNPKFYFKGQRKFAWYLGQGFYASYINLNRVDYYYTFRSTFQNDSYNWNVVENSFESFNENRIIFRYEGAIGLSISLLKDFGLSSELGYSTAIRKENNGFDQVFIREQGGAYQLDSFKEQFAPDYRSNLIVNPYFRLHLVYRFGGVKNIIN